MNPSLPLTYINGEKRRRNYDLVQGNFSQRKTNDDGER
jgi:hypothetical protein